MKIINLSQGSKEWLAWRKSVITATDCSCILGSNPWTSVYKCWQRKLDLIPEQESNFAMEEGCRLEPISRDRFNLDNKTNMQPVVVESEEYNFLGASLDGMDEEGNILEIKNGGAELFNNAKQGIIPQYYIDQMQHQLLVTGSPFCYYDCSYRGESLSIKVYPDPKFKEIYLPLAREFWKCVAFVEAPAMINKDYIDKSSNADWLEYTKVFIEQDNIIKDAEEKKEIARKKLIYLCGDQSSQGNGIKVMKIANKGRINYDDIPELKTIDLNKYRKEHSISWKVLVDRKHAC